ncbi:MAG: SDR family oxidoreductase [Bryobacteraceae bacterium]
MKQWLKGAQGSPRTGKPIDIAPLAVFLSSSASDYVTGQTIAVDGGYTTTAVWPLNLPDMTRRGTDRPRRRWAGAEAGRVRLPDGFGRTLPAWPLP